MELDRRALLRLSSGTGLAAVVTAALPFALPGAAPAAAAAARGAVGVRQLRGMWVASVGNMDWPMAQGLSAAQQKKQFTTLLDLAQGLHLNAIVSQVRPAADTFWPSKLEPWSQYLTGVQGRSPGYDPLQFQIAQTHARGMEFHAWINPFRVSTQSKLSALSKGHPARKHPDWVYEFNGGLYYNPGIPAVRAHVSAVVMEIVAHYDIDAIHFDDYFYPYPVDGKKVADAKAHAAHGKGASLGSWRRANIDAFVKGMGEQIHRKKPAVKFGISPFGIWRNRSSDRNGSKTGGTESYSANYADTRKWVKSGWVDYIAPQLYWANGDRAADYATLAAWWADVVKGTKVSLYIGQAAYKVSGGEFRKAGELAAHVAQDAKIPQITGELLFSAQDVKRDPKGAIGTLRSGAFALPALPPVNRARGGRAPVAPAGVRAAAQGSAVKVSWTGGNATWFAIWRTKGRAVTAADTADARNLVAVVHSTGRGVNAFSDRHPAKGGQYAVTGYDRLWNQSGLGSPTAAKRRAAAAGGARDGGTTMSGGADSQAPSLSGGVSQP